MYYDIVVGVAAFGAFASAVFSAVMALKNTTKKTAWEPRLLDNMDPIKIRLKTLPLDELFSTPQKLPYKGIGRYVTTYVSITLITGETITVNKIVSVDYGAVELFGEYRNSSVYTDKSIGPYHQTIRYSAIAVVSIDNVEHHRAG